MPKSHWYVYMLRCADNTLYSGITTDLVRRVSEHNGDKKGAKYTKARRPVSLVYNKKCKDRSAAGQAEAALRKLTKAEKEKLVT
ncbi:MAG: putative endonuclease [Candidatus Azotimanducaceae bacterium]|jgi:putative endonuclease